MVLPIPWRPWAHTVNFGVETFVIQQTGCPHLQSDDGECEEKIVSAQRMKAAADAYCIGSAIASKRFSSILGIPEPKP